MATAEKMQEQSNIYSDNIVSGFSMYDNLHTWTVSAGSGSGSHDDQYKFSGQRSLKVINTDVQNTDLTISSASNTIFTIDGETGNYILSFYVRANTVGGLTETVNGTVQIFVGGVPTEYDFTIETDDFDKWTRRTQLLSLTANDKVTYNVKLKQNASSTNTSQSFWLDGFMVNEDNRGLGYPPRFQYPLNYSGVTKIGFFDYNDLATQTTAISFTGTPVVLTNDGLGSNTLKDYAPTGVTDVFDSSANAFDWTQLSLGDMVDIRIDFDVTTTVSNQDVTVYLELGQGGTSYTIPFISNREFKTATAHLNQGAYNGIYMGNTNTLDNPARFYFDSTDNATITVNGFYCKIIER